YTSPHLDDFAERIQINQQKIPHEKITSLFGKIAPFLEDRPFTNTFEIITAIAFEYFSESKIDIAVVEVGLGGRYDPTNVVLPLVSVITSISFDHMDLLGDTLEEIAYEKAGIIKRNVPVIVGQQKKMVTQVLEKVANEAGAVVVSAEQYSPKNLQTATSGHSFQLSEMEADAIEVQIPLLGIHQVENAQLAFAVLIEARKLGLQISDSAIIQGFRTVKWPGRYEILSYAPLIIVDGAHNVDSIERVIETTRLVFPEKKIHLLYGTSTGKDVEGMLRVLFPECETCVFTQSTHPKSMAVDILVQLAQQMEYPASVKTPVEQALRKALQDISDDGLLLCTGSLFIAAAVRDIWKEVMKEMQDE
ncbi:hypothetical protein EH221_01645, partial [bacterium]